jgi:hypothetical protein
VLASTQVLQDLFKNVVRGPLYVSLYARRSAETGALSFKEGNHD